MIARPADHEAAIMCAARYLQSTGLRVLDRDWYHGEGHLDIIAADGGVLVVCVVKTGRRGGRHPLAALSRGRARSKRRLAVAWMREHGTRYQEIRVDAFAIIYEGTGGYTTEHAKAVG